MKDFNMRIFLSGYSGSKHILPASSFLIDKYIPDNFEVNFLNFGEYDQNNLFCGNYVKLEDNDGGSSLWSKYLSNYFSSLDDEFVIFGLDDFFLCRKMDMGIYQTLLEMMVSNSDIACAKLGIGGVYRTTEYEMISDNIYCLKEKSPYSSSTQYSIWKRKSLIGVLNNVTDAWSFEIRGTQHLNNSRQRVIGSTTICLPYSEISALSNKHPNKISILGLNQNVIEEMIMKKLLDESQLIVGQPLGNVGKYSDYKNSVVDALDLILDVEHKYYCRLIYDLVENNNYKDLNNV